MGTWSGFKYQTRRQRTRRTDIFNVSYINYFGLNKGKAICYQKRKITFKSI